MMLARIVTPALAERDIQIGGSRPGDPAVVRKDFYRKVVFKGSLGLGEAYMNGDWQCQDLDVFFAKLLSRGAPSPLFGTLKEATHRLRHWLRNQQSPAKASEVCRHHYDISPAFFQQILDQRMTYSCGHWPDERTSLDDSQRHKFETICQLLELKPGMRVLDIGCGWGSFLKYAAEHYGIHGTGYSLSQNQVIFARQSTKGLPVQIVYDDYRNITGTYDRIVSIEMLEAVGWKNLKTFMAVARACIAPGGTFFLQTVGRSVKKASGDQWVDTYIFPNGMLPTRRQVEDAASGWRSELIAERGLDYDKTLMAWRKNLDAQAGALLTATERRMWEYYFSAFAGSFRARHCLLYQFLLTAKA